MVLLAFKIGLPASQAHAFNQASFHSVFAELLAAGRIRLLSPISICFTIPFFLLQMAPFFAPPCECYFAAHSEMGFFWEAFPTFPAPSSSAPQPPQTVLPICGPPRRAENGDTDSRWLISHSVVPANTQQFWLLPVSPDCHQHGNIHVTFPRE